jgi:hypothetical protein
MRVSAERTSAAPVDPVPRNRLALSILQQRTFCAPCLAHVDEAVLALLGATLDELRERHTA